MKLEQFCTPKLLETFHRAAVKFACSSDAENTEVYQNRELNCGCSIISSAFCEYLKIHGYKAKVCFGYFSKNPSIYLTERTKFDDNHCWVECGKYIIDLTVGQFIDESYIMVKKTDLRYRKHSDKISRKKTWPRGQRPKVRLTQTILKYFANETFTFTH